MASDQKVRQAALMFSWFMLILVAAYGSILSSNFAYNDDYMNFQIVRRGIFEFTHNAFVSPQGRPLGGLWIWLTFAPVGGIDGLKWMRIVSVVGIALFATALFFLHRRCGFSRRMAMGVSALVVLTPAFGVYATWLTLMCGGYCACAAMIGGWLVWDAMDRPKWQVRHILQGSVGYLLILQVFLTYHPIAPLCMYSFVALAHRKESTGGNAIPAFIKSVGVFLLAVLSAYFVYLILVKPWGQAAGAVRGIIATDIGSKLIYAGRIVWSSATLWTRLEPLWVQVVSMTWVSLLCLGWFIGVSWNRGIRLAGLMLVGFPLAVLPVLVVTENDLQYRSHVGGQALVVYIAACGIANIWRRCGAGQAMHILKTVPGLVIAVSVVTFVGLAHYHVKHGLVEPNVREVTRLREAVQCVEGDYPGKVVFYSPEPSWMSKNCISEFGVIASPASWNTGAMLELLLDEKFNKTQYSLAEKNLRLIVLGAKGENEKIPVIDGFGVVHREELVAVNDPYWGALRKVPSGWCMSSWFGAFDGRRFPAIWHAKFGHLYCLEKKDPAHFWFRHSTLGFMVTNPGSFPFVHFSETKKWMWVDQNILTGLVCYPDNPEH